MSRQSHCETDVQAVAALCHAIQPFYATHQLTPRSTGMGLSEVDDDCHNNIHVSPKGKDTSHLIRDYAAESRLVARFEGLDVEKLAGFQVSTDYDMWLEGCFSS